MVKVEEPKEVMVVEPEEQEIINSKTIQSNIKRSVQSVLDEAGVNPSRETDIENLKEQLDSFVEDNKQIYDKIDKLKFLNLTATPSVQKTLVELQNEEIKINNKIRDIKSKIKSFNQVKEDTEKYKKQYPNFKFVDKKTMTDILHKYELVMGEAFTYAREIPNDSLEIIGLFSDEISQSEKVKYLVKKTDHRALRVRVTYALTDKDPSDIDTGLVSMYVEGTYKISRFKMVAPESHFNIPTVKQRLLGMFGTEEGGITPLMKLNPDTRVFEFNVEEVNRIESEKMEVLDPIALLEVEGGYIVMDAWDEEADIMEIRNTVDI